MKTTEKLIQDFAQDVNPVRILLVGNNPIELSTLLETLATIPGRVVITETAFDTRSLCSRLLNFDPDFILIDDNIGKVELNHSVAELSGNPKTSQVPITVIKNSNYSESIISDSILDYLLKKNITADLILTTIKNTLKFKRTRKYLKQVLDARKELLLKVV
jgi:CheY-like chemotaxis protein